ncbi:GNAT family N-acetyltransferase [uncultured Dysosmobacter sp.]|uniref:GNAT family N-acetyltransferase n=1 Tax=uncultured Dysosmobacter sp. TaxID=2591384 RepID=UPI00262BC715|nr:GNAT family N-acetyltransferase [uncultured Dysosmobacter sp.]
MCQFKPVTKQDASRLRKYYKTCQYGLCEYSVGTKLMWRNTLHPAWAEIAGCLVVRNTIDGQTVFDYPVAGPEGDEDAALDAIEAYCLERGVPPVISVVPECKAPRLLARYPYARVSNIRTWRDYVYYREDLQLFAGRRYSGQRNHIKKFRTQWPDAEFRRLTAADEPVIQQFWQDYEAEFPKGDNAKARDELGLAKRMLRMVDKPWFLAGGMFDGERLVALSLAERCGDTLIIHIEKALYSYTGVYPTLVQTFANAFGDGCQWINREDDAADRGLRTSKLQYGPAKLAPKYRFQPQNELLQHVDAIPALQTERLTLTALTEADIPAYNALVLDGERNRWWGYDDVGGLGGPVEERSFFDVARRDFEARQAVNFAVRLDGKLIGEAVLYRFDCRGGAELGCRIDSAYAGHGYGTEAFAAVADWALYKVHLSRVVAKCFKENQASYKMLSACMRKHGEDETFFYFEKLV